MKDDTDARLYVVRSSTTRRPVNINGGRNRRYAMHCLMFRKEIDCVINLNICPGYGKISHTTLSSTLFVLLKSTEVAEKFVWILEDNKWFSISAKSRDGRIKFFPLYHISVSEGLKAKRPKPRIRLFQQWIKTLFMTWLRLLAPPPPPLPPGTPANQYPALVLLVPMPAVAWRYRRGWNSLNKELNQGG